MQQYAHSKSARLIGSIRLLALGLVAPLLCVSACLAQSAKPTITKIDPPNWFTQLPDSLLLVHGENLENTTFTVRHTDASITKTTISPNGHWAFLTFVTKSAHPGKVEIVATNPRGTTKVSYVLSARRSVEEQPKGFSSADVMYLIMPDRFADGDKKNDQVKGFREPDDRNSTHAYHGGDLRGIEEHLDYLKRMGVTTLWTTPLYDNSAGQSGGTYHGYSATDMYAIDPHFGTMKDYRALVAAAHARGMKVVLDTVPNHVGAAHPWAQDQPMPGWLHGTPQSHIKVDDDFKSVTDPKADAARRRVLLDGWFANVLPDLNQDNPYVAQYLTQNAIWWIESAGLDGLRIDTFPYVPRSFWHDYNEELHALYPHLSDVGEVFNGDPKVTSFFAGGRANLGSDGRFDTLLDTPFDYPMFFALRGALTHHKPMTAIADVLDADKLYPHPERLVIFFGNHDTKRFLSENGASLAALHLGYGLLATLRGMPQLYYGDEIEMNGGDDPNNRRDFPGGFAKDKVDAFTNAGLTADQQAMHAWVTTLMALRASTPALENGKLQLLLADKDSLAFVRSEDVVGNCRTAAGTARYVVVVNNSAEARTVAVPVDANALTGCGRFASMLKNGAAAQVSGDKLQVQLPGEEIGIFQAQP
jgi:glycosidase